MEDPLIRLVFHGILWAKREEGWRNALELTVVRGDGPPEQFVEDEHEEVSSCYL